ncbi:hypothetical protein LJC55_00210 [Eubacteriales bacterium OttesenSCG-928-N14]|nr:hypothetical protein [Eubacteriales bacterium OttesenSCG-928-N14]
MIVAHLIERTLININEDVDAQTVLEYRDRIVDLMNEAYQELIATRIKPKKSCTVMVGEDGLIQRPLPEDMLQIAELTTTGGMPLRYEMREDGVFVYHHTGQAQMRYIYMPPYLVEDDDEPDLTDWAHYALSDYATWRLMSTGSRARQVRGEVFLGQYLTTIARLAAVSSRAQQIVNKY